jgi:hypothetical protein
MLFCCRTGTCAACRTERRLAGAAIVGLIAFTVADNTNPDLQLMPPLAGIETASTSQTVAKFGQRLDGTTPPLQVAAAAANNEPAPAPRPPAVIALRSSLK